MNILVTGGAGFIGSNLVEELSKENNVTVLDNLHSGNTNNIKHLRGKIKFVNGSYNDIFKIKLPNESFDIIYHLGIPSSSPMYKEDPNLVGKSINGAINMFEFCLGEEAEKIIYASSSSLYSGLTPPHKENMEIQVTDYYTEARLAIERMAKLENKLYGLKSVGLRFCSVYGPHEEAKCEYANIVTQFLWRMQRGESPIIYGDGSQSRDFVFVKDVVQACTLMMGYNIDCEILNVGTGKSHTFNDVVSILNQKLKINIIPIHIPMPVKNYVDKTLADLTEIKKFGYDPKYSLSQGIDELMNNKNV